MRPPLLRLHADEIVTDCFAGGGGASLAIEMALGRSPDIAVNHDPEAIAMHAVNHPNTRHLCGDVWDVDPEAVCGGKPVGLAWFSPDCKHFSKAKGGKPVAKKIRGLAWVVVRWARTVKPRIILLENVEEFQDWGPLLDDNRPDPLRRGFTFRRWVSQLKACGYQVELRELRACDYGAPTSRKRLFVIARCDGLPIVWPQPTHGRGLPTPHRAAAECIEWSLPCPSIFDRARPLAEKTMARIARGVHKFVLGSARPFIVRTAHGDVDRHGHRRGRGEHSLDEPLPTVLASRDFGLVAPSLIQQSWGEREGQAPRCLDIGEPLGTIVAGGIKHALVAAFLAKHYGDRATGGFAGGSQAGLPFGSVTTRDHHALVTSHLMKFQENGAGFPPTEPMHTVMAGAARFAEVRAFLTKFYGTSTGQPMQIPLGTVCAGAEHFGLVRVDGADYEIADIGMRMLVPRELFRAQGFPDSYVIDPVVDGAPLTKTAQVRMVGNSVSPPVAAALIAANVAARAAEVA